MVMPEREQVKVLECKCLEFLFWYCHFLVAAAPQKNC